jgi:seryl-tRNA synthetase
MIDLKLLRQQPDIFKNAAEQKGVVVDIDRFLEVDASRLTLQQELDRLRAQRNELAKAKDADKEKGKMLKEMVKAKEEEVRLLDHEHQELLFMIPNIPAPDSPVGPDAASNVELDAWGEPRNFNFPIKDHLRLAESLDLVDFERGVKIHGFRGYVLKNEAVLLQQAILQLALQKMMARGFTPMIPPVLVHESALYGSGHFPFGREGIFELKNTEEKETKDRFFLAGTSEPSLLAFRSDEVLDAAELPLKYCGISPCYRNEVGSYGKDTKGLYRIHEFWKVEQVVICKNDMAEAERHFSDMEDVAREMLKDLELPHRVVNCSTGDMGAGKYKMHDIETWMPGRDSYGETHSNSMLTDWQARRLNLRYKDADGSKVFCHTLNNTVIASPRILIALLENHQQKDGCVVIPKALRAICGFDKISPKKKAA